MYAFRGRIKRKINAANVMLHDLLICGMEKLVVCTLKCVYNSFLEFQPPFQHHRFCQNFMYENQMFSVVGLNLKFLGRLVILCILVWRTRETICLTIYLSQLIV